MALVVSDSGSGEPRNSSPASRRGRLLTRPLATATVRDLRQIAFEYRLGPLELRQQCFSAGGIAVAGLYFSDDPALSII